jgi:hypothetical protein
MLVELDQKGILEIEIDEEYDEVIWIIYLFLNFFIK